MKLELVLNLDSESGEGLEQLAALFAGVGALLQSQKVVAQRQRVSQETPTTWHVCAVADVQATGKTVELETPRIVAVTDLPTIKPSRRQRRKQQALNDAQTRPADAPNGVDLEADLVE